MIRIENITGRFCLLAALSVAGIPEGMRAPRALPEDKITSANYKAVSGRGY
ncbi:MAG: hypothetical protein Q9M82_02685 [Mariprofundus sp.]|nr:hypothetical protein [Mariprofundus sp.]